jgi:hypothetical protein
MIFDFESENFNEAAFGEIYAAKRSRDHQLQNTKIELESNYCYSRKITQCLILKNNFVLKNCQNYSRVLLVD